MTNAWWQWQWGRWNRWLPSGYSDLGSILIPPPPHKIVLTDQATGVQWQLTYDLNTNVLTTTTPNLTGEGALLYDKDSGPRFQEDGHYTLTLTNGTYGVSFAAYPTGIEDMQTEPIYARNGNSYRQVLLSEFI
jgi:hypothetical protein